jgi:Costars
LQTTITTITTTITNNDNNNDNKNDNNNNNNNNNNNITNRSFKNRIHEEMEHLLMDIRRIPPTGEPFVSFGDLFDDDHVQQYYESLIGTLKSAKKRT